MALYRCLENAALFQSSTLVYTNTLSGGSATSMLIGPKLIAANAKYGLIIYNLQNGGSFTIKINDSKELYRSDFLHLGNATDSAYLLTQLILFTEITENTTFVETQMGNSYRGWALFAIS